MQIKEAIVERIKNICLERGMKYNKLATRSGVTPSTVYSMLDPSRRARLHGRWYRRIFRFPACALCV